MELRKSKPSYDELYTFVDDKKVEGCTRAERLLVNGYKTSYDELLNYVDELMIEGNDGARKLLNGH